MTSRKGQKLCNWIQEQGYAREHVYIKLSTMDDEQFDRIVNMEVDYEVPNDTPEGNKTIREQTLNMLKFICEPAEDFHKKNKK